jgi:hypothetical protein
MIYELKNVVDATQITQAMFDGKEPVPKCCYRLATVVHGEEVPGGDAAIVFIPHNIKDRRRVKVGEWVVDSIFATKVLTEQEFNKFVKHECPARA